MAGVNKVILVGNLGNDPEVRHLNSGAVVANFNLATSETYTNRNGEKVTQTEWHRVELWDNLARVAENYLKKGKSVYVEGKIKTDNWEDQEGVKRSTTKIRALSMQLLGGKGDDSYNNSNYAQSQPSSGNQGNPSGSESGYNNNDVNPEIEAQEDEIDDLPF